jgi:hypothetical protein
MKEGKREANRSGWDEVRRENERDIERYRGRKGRG